MTLGDHPVFVILLAAVSLVFPTVAGMLLSRDSSPASGSGHG
jgi:hypothetical protein